MSSVQVKRAGFMACFLTVVLLGTGESAVKPAGIAFRLEKAAGYPTDPMVPVVDIPRLAHPPTIDGVIAEDEWRGSASTGNFLVLFTNTIALPATTCLLGLDGENLYLAFRCGLVEGVSPRAEAKKGGGSVFGDDSVEFFIWPDGSQPSYCQFVVNSLGARFASKTFFNPSSGNRVPFSASWVPQWEAKARQERGAWTLEMAIPWKTLALKPEGIKGIRLNLCRNTIPGKSLYSSWGFLTRANSPFHNLERFGVGICRFEEPKKNTGTVPDLGLGALGLLRIAFSTTGKVEVKCVAALPKHPLFENQVDLAVEAISVDLNGPRPGPPAKTAQFRLPRAVPGNLVIEGPGLDNYLLNLRLSGAGFTLSRSVVVLPGMFHEITERLHTADLPVLAQAEPFKAAGYLGAASSAARSILKVPSGDLQGVLAGVKETLARLDLLEQGTVGRQDSLLRLLDLAGYPESQVVVSSEDWSTGATITFYWGSIPLSSVRIRRFPTREEAVAGLGTGNESSLVALSDTTVFEGNPARVMPYTFEGIELTGFDPLDQAVLVDRKSRIGIVLDLRDISRVKQADAVSVLPGCPDKVMKTMNAWAKERNLLLLSFDDAMKKNTVLVAGDVRTVMDKKSFSDLRILGLMPVGNLSVARGQDLLSVNGAPSGSVAEQALRMVLAGTPVFPAEVDALRIEIVNAAAGHYADSKAPLPPGFALFSGDLHLHTVFSDGTSTPAQLALETMYCNMDFAAITDHNTIEGAKLGKKLLAGHGFAYPLIVGEEITTAQPHFNVSPLAHFNAYPLTETVPWTLSSYETVKAAHRQGAVIQLNHAGSIDISGTGLDALEHYPGMYDVWKKAGMLPTLTGGTDTHNDIFEWPERTLVLSPSPEGDDVAEAIRRGNTVLVLSGSNRLFYGSDEMLGYAWSALREGLALKAGQAGRLKDLFKNADIIGLLKNIGSLKNRGSVVAGL
jgi:hypothetical protein